MPGDDSEVFGGAGVYQLHQPALLHGGPHERGKQRVRLEGARLELGVELDADEPGMVLAFDHLRQEAVRRHGAEAHALWLGGPPLGGVDLVAWRWRSEIPVAP